jgi:hypothetical protein
MYVVVRDIVKMDISRRVKSMKQSTALENLVFLAELGLYRLLSFFCIYW